MLMTTTIGELCAGYGGLGLGLGLLGPVRNVWVADVEPGPCAVLAHRLPSAPNLGDITSVDWTCVEPVDVVAGGTPCQDLSTAGLRAGMRAGSRSGLWASMLQAVTVIRPSVVVWENVSGARSATADSRLESNAGRVGGRADGPVLRALGRVLGDLAECGYDAQWTVAAASDVGAPHRRERVFVLAHRRGSANAERVLRDWAGCTWDRRDECPDGGGGPLAILPTPAARDAKGAGLPRQGGPTLHGAMIPAGPTDEARQLLATPVARPDMAQSPGNGVCLDDQCASFGRYAEAVAVWEQVLGRPAPKPTEPSTNGGRRISAAFVEWMMGLPAGWVTEVPGVSRARQLRMLGNGVVPQQAARALAVLAGWGLVA